MKKEIYTQNRSTCYELFKHSLVKNLFSPQNAVYLVWINTMHIDKRFVYGPAQVNVNLDVVVEGNSIIK